jgi:outer membrane protein assembly factor BamE (lipoprotein component of BamABCDE complex)
MKKILILLLSFTILNSCVFKKRVDHHGVHLLKKKSEKIIIAETNKNDIVKLLGPPSTISNFDNDLYFYIERKITTKPLIKLGKQKFLENNVLIIEIDNRGIASKKEFYDLNKMKKIKIVSAETTVDYNKQSFIYDFLSSMRQKVNDPLGKRKRD